MNEPKPFASLSPSLLARKGGARPAMRPQLLPLSYEDQRRMGYPAATLVASATDEQDLAFPDHDDLGWNDMGEDAAMPVPAPAADVIAIAADPLPEPTQPEVLRRIESLAGAMRTSAPGANAPEAELPKAVDRRPRGSALKDGRKAAFTLRLDAERHLRLRLACTVDNRSAQQLVVEALDCFLETKPGLADLARRARQS
ncbi:MAG: hypothetical protein ACKVOL_14410 [Novosphingobium sp.]